jgi:Na+-driven multidrug efflux pump
VALDSINKTDKNLWKVIFMATANIIGDLVAIYVFNSLFWVAMATILNTIVGLFMGYYYLGKFEEIKYRKFLINGIRFYKELKSRGLKMAGK